MELMEKEKVFVFDADYIEEESPKVRLWGKTKEGKNIILFFKTLPYFFVLPKNLEKAKREIKEFLEKEKIKIEKIETKKRKIFGKEAEFLKIFASKPSNLLNIREKIKTLEEKRKKEGQILDEFEYSIHFYRKFLIDNNINGSCWLEVEGEKIKHNYNVDLAIEVKNFKVLEGSVLPEFKILAFDIETIEKGGEKEIIMVSFYGKNYQKVLTSKKGNYPKFVEILNSEKNILEEIIKIFQRENPDIVLTYYGDFFDFPTLIERCQKQKIKLLIARDGSEIKLSKRGRFSVAKISGIFHFDLFNFIRNIISPNLQTEILTLDKVASEILKDKKIEINYQELLESWKEEKNLEKLAEYCLKDSELTFRLGEIFLPQVIEISRIVGQTLFDVSRMSYGQLVEWYFSKKTRESGEVIPNQPKFEEILKRKKETYAGAFVKEPIPGLHEKIGVVDFRSLYPSFIVSFNISPETLNCLCCKDNGYRVPELNYWFCKKKEGFVARIVKELIEKRIQIKSELKGLKEDSREYKILNTRQFVFKIIANATYGYLGFPGSRWYSKECAESCTAFGRYIIKKTIDQARKEGFSVIYADTDSLFLKHEKGDIKNAIFDFLEKINKKFPGILELELQGIYERGIFIPRGSFGSAKKRYALIDEKGNLIIRGLETVRRDWCNLAKEVQRKILEFILKEKNIDGAKKFVKEVINNLRKRNVDLKDLTIYEELAKPVEDYKLISPHVMAAKKLKEKGQEVREGQVIMFVIQEGLGSISEKAEPVEFAKLEKIDIDYYITHQIIPAAMRILQVFGVSENELLWN